MQIKCNRKAAKLSCFHFITDQTGSHVDYTKCKYKTKIPAHFSGLDLIQLVLQFIFIKTCFMTPSRGKLASSADNQQMALSNNLINVRTPEVRKVSWRCDVNQASDVV